MPLSEAHHTSTKLYRFRFQFFVRLNSRWNLWQLRSCWFSSYVNESANWFVHECKVVKRKKNVSVCHLSVFPVLPCPLFQPQIPVQREIRKNTIAPRELCSGCLKTLVLSQILSTYLCRHVKTTPNVCEHFATTPKGQPIFLEAIDEVGNWFVVILSVDKCALEGRVSIASWRLNNHCTYIIDQGHGDLSNTINNTTYFNSWRKYEL